MSEEQLRRQLYESFANRAHVYHLLFEQLREELGAERAADLMGRAIRRRGAQNAARYAPFAPGDLEGLKEAFVGSLPDEGAMFAPEVVRCDAGGLEEVAGLCRIAAQVDVGLFEAAGFRFWADTYRPGGEGCCFLHVRPGQ